MFGTCMFPILKSYQKERPVWPIVHFICRDWCNRSTRSLCGGFLQDVCVPPFVSVLMDVSTGEWRQSRAACGPIATVLIATRDNSSVGDGAQLEIRKGWWQTESSKKTQRPCREASHAWEGRNDTTERVVSGKREKSAQGLCRSASVKALFSSNVSFWG